MVALRSNAMTTLRSRTRSSGAYYRFAAFNKGLARSFDLFGQLGRTGDCLADPEALHAAVYRSIQSDWEVIGLDMRRAMQMFEDQHKLRVCGFSDEDTDGEAKRATSRSSG